MSRTDKWEHPTDTYTKYLKTTRRQDLRREDRTEVYFWLEAMDR